MYIQAFYDTTSNRNEMFHEGLKKTSIVDLLSVIEQSLVCNNALQYKKHFVLDDRPRMLINTKNSVPHATHIGYFTENFGIQEKRNINQKTLVSESNGLIPEFMQMLLLWQQNVMKQYYRLGNLNISFSKFLIEWRTSQVDLQITRNIFCFLFVLIFSWISEKVFLITVIKRCGSLFQNIYDADVLHSSIDEIDQYDFKEKKTILKKISERFYKNKKIRLLFYSISYFILHFTAIFIFYIVANIISFIISANFQNTQEYLYIFIDIYCVTQFAILLTRLIVSPNQPVLRLIHFSNNTAYFIYRWMRRLIFILSIAYMGNEFLRIYRIPNDLQVAWIKLFGLIFHCSLLMMVFQSRNLVTSFLNISDEKTLSGLRRIIAKLWIWFAVSLIFIIWILWTFGVEDGLQRIVYFFSRTVLLLLGAYLILLLFDALFSVFFGAYQHATSKIKKVQNITPLDEEYACRQHRLYTILKYTTFLLVIVIDGLFLLNVWDVKIINWILYHEVGRRVFYAIRRIFFLNFTALLIWESINLIIINRFKYWQDTDNLVKMGRLRTLLPMMRTGLMAIILLFLGSCTLRELGIDITPLLAGVSLIGVAIGFGSQKLIQDVVTGLFLLLENAIQVGDVITIAGATGVVEHLSIRAVRVRSPDGSLNTIPFSAVSIVNNGNRGIANALFKVALAYPVDLDRVKQIFFHVAEEMREESSFSSLILENLDWWGVESMNGASVTIAAQLKTVDAARLKVQREFNRRLLECFRKEKIELDNPKSYFLIKS